METSSSTLNHNPVLTPQATIPSTASTGVLAPDTWGFAIPKSQSNLTSYADIFSSSYSIETNTPSSSQIYTTTPTTTTKFAETDTYSGGTDSYALYFGANVPGTKPSGTYQTTITYTAISAPDPLPTYRTFANGTAIYYNPNTGLECTETDYDNNTGSLGTGASGTGNNTGCMKWYTFNDDEYSDRVDMILDHSTTATVAWNSSGSNATGPSELTTQLWTDTDGWHNKLTRSDSYTFNNTSGGGSINYTINYVGHKARLISAQEIATITKHPTFDEAAPMTSFYLETNSYDCDLCSTLGRGNAKYGWLFDRTLGTIYNAEAYGSPNNSDVIDSGYWTSSPVSDTTNLAWRMGPNGMLSRNTVGLLAGVRPVVTVQKTALKYQNGTEVYFNPETGAKCSNYVEANSDTGNNEGCMKWYSFNDTPQSDAVNLLLDHNTTEDVMWNSSGSNAGPDELTTQLWTDTDSWHASLTRSDSYTVNYGGKNFTINYSGHKARLISANEIAQITGHPTFDETTSTSSQRIYFETNTNNCGDCLPLGQGNAKYGWLFDRTHISDCTIYGCPNNSNVETHGYWTSSPVSNSIANAWRVSSSDTGGRLESGRVDNVVPYGLRPVITVSKYRL